MEKQAVSLHVQAMVDTLQTLRDEIDLLDGALVNLLAKRQAVVERVVAYKQANGVPARLPDRIAEVIRSAVKQAEIVQCDPDLARTVFSAMVEWFVQHEEQRLTQPQPK